jgi:hypothetical protein
MHAGDARRQVGFQDDRDAAGPHVAHGRAERPRRVALVHQDEAAHERVHRTLETERLDPSPAKLDVAEAVGGRARPRRLERRQRRVHAQHVSATADDPRRDEGHVPGATAHVEDAHPGPEACGDEGRACDLLEQRPLRGQPLELTRRVAAEVDAPQSSRSQVSATRSWPKLLCRSARTRRKPAFS